MQPSDRATSLFVYLGGLLFSLLIFISHASLPSEGPERFLVAFIWPCLFLKSCFWFLIARLPGSIRKEGTCRREAGWPMAHPGPLAIDLGR